jgi:hypothetical protein
MVKKKGKKVEKLELPKEPETEPVASVTEVALEVESSPPTEESEEQAAVTVSELPSDAVQVTVTRGSLSYLEGGDVKSFEKGDTFITSRERASRLDQRFIKIA